MGTPAEESLQTATAVAAGGPPEGHHPALFTLDPGLAIWTWITFILLLVLMKKYVFRPLLAGLKAREDAIATSLDRSEHLDRELAGIDVKCEALLADARHQADAVLRKARGRADRLREELKARAQEEADTIIAEARRKADEERTAALRSVEAEIVDLICTTSGRLVDRSFTDEEDAAFTRSLVEQSL